MFGIQDEQNFLFSLKFSDHNRSKNSQALEITNPNTKILVPVSQTEYCKNHELYNALLAFRQQGVDVLKQIYFVNTSYLHRHPSKRDELKKSENELYGLARQWHDQWLKSLQSHLFDLGIVPPKGWEEEHLVDWETLTSKSESFKQQRDELAKNYNLDGTTRGVFDKTINKRLRKNDSLRCEAEDYAAGVIHEKYLNGSEKSEKKEEVSSLFLPLIEIKGQSPKRSLHIKKVDIKSDPEHSKARSQLVQEFNEAIDTYLVQSDLGQKVLDYLIEESAFIASDDIRNVYGYMYYPRSLTDCIVHTMQNHVWNRGLAMLHFISGVEKKKFYPQQQYLPQPINRSASSYGHQSTLSSSPEKQFSDSLSYTESSGSSSEGEEPSDEMNSEEMMVLNIIETLFAQLKVVGQLTMEPTDSLSSGKIARTLKKKWGTNGHTDQLVSIITSLGLQAPLFLRLLDTIKKQGVVPQQSRSSYAQLPILQTRGHNARPVEHRLKSDVSFMSPVVFQGKHVGDLNRGQTAATLLPSSPPMGGCENTSYDTPRDTFKNNNG